MRPHPRLADTDPSNPRAWGTCEACGFVTNVYKMSWRYDWRGTSLTNLRVLVCQPCVDKPQRQLGTIILPPDPMPVLNARPEQYFIDEQDYQITADYTAVAGDILSCNGTFTVTLPTAVGVNGQSVSINNDGSGTISVTPVFFLGNDTYTKVLLHMDGTDAATTFTDSNAGGSSHTWTARGDAQTDTAQIKFGSASGLFDGTGDYVDTPDSANFTLGSGDFTVDFWIMANVDGTAINIAGQVDVGGGANANTAWYLTRTAGNLIQALVTQGTTQTGAQSTTTLTAAKGWMHIAFVRRGNSLKLFINGVQEGGNVAFSGSVNDSTAKLGVGSLGDLVSAPWNGWIDEFRFSVGVPRWTSNFTPPTTPYGNSIYALAAGSSLTVISDGTNWNILP